jgi:hypothetical protein
MTPCTPLEMTAAAQAGAAGHALRSEATPPAPRGPRLAPSPRTRPLAVPAAADAVNLGALLRFKALMGREGMAVQVPRMCFDRLYAYECIALAHAGGQDALRRLALELFQAYHRRDEQRHALAA